jgi:hypothetical protein
MEDRAPMSPRRPWLSFERHGGAVPRDDEALALGEDGGFKARRTIGGPCIGAFEGALAGATMARLRKGVAALEGAKDVEIATPRHGATETLVAGRRTFRAGSNEAPPKPWGALIKSVRAVLEDEVVEHPKAAIRLVADRATARLEQAGAGAIEADLGTLRVRVVLMGKDDAVRGQWVGRPAEGRVDNGETMVATPRWVTADGGWSAPLPFEHGLRPGAGDWLQVWVDLPIRSDGAARAGRLYVPVLSDA